jgi:regulator of nucleoside diphosphate kinase
MSGSAQFVMTDRDYAILRGIALARPSGERGYFDLLRHKLVHTRIVAPEEIDPEVVTMNSQVRYRVGDGRWLEHRLVLGAAREVIGQTVSLRSMHGLALLGMRDEQIFEYDPEQGPVTVNAVLYQPEADAEVVDYGRARMWRGR